jgi:hypothetical protein
LFGLIFIGAATACVFYLYEALANEASIRYLLSSVVVALVGKSLATAFKNIKDEMDYVDQLAGYGLSKDEATSAWEIMSNGGSNLLLNWQQADTITESDLKESEESSPNADE